MKILAGDIGGTKTLMQIADVQGKAVEVLHEQRFDSHAFSSFDALLKEYLEQVRAQQLKPAAACIGIAGPVKSDEAKVTNLPWNMNATQLQQQSGIPRIRFINDFQAVGFGIEALQEQDLVTLQAGEPERQGVRAVIGAGTGLGHGLLIWRDDHYEAYPSEGGHIGFAPTDDVQIELLRFMRKQLDIVSYEHLVSGPGLGKIFDFVCQHWQTPLSESLQHAMRAGDKAAAVTSAALAHSDEQAQRALDIFIRIYGAQAGNLALITLSRGGVYIAGGIAPKILPALQQESFMAAFSDKGKMQHLMPGFPVKVITNPKVGIMGAALVASRIAK
jgi:glucokinase